MVAAVRVVKACEAVFICRDVRVASGGREGGLGDKRKTVVRVCVHMWRPEGEVTSSFLSPTGLKLTN